MKKILVPYDFSPVSEHALDLACQIADKVSSEIMLLNVIEHPTADSFKTMGIQNMDPMEQLYIKKMYEKVNEKLGYRGAIFRFRDDSGPLRRLTRLGIMAGMKIATASYPLDVLPDWAAYEDKLSAWVVVADIVCS